MEPKNLFEQIQNDYAERQKREEEAQKELERRELVKDRLKNSLDSEVSSSISVIDETGHNQDLSETIDEEAVQEKQRQAEEAKAKEEKRKNGLWGRLFGKKDRKKKTEDISVRSPEIEGR